MYVYCVDPATSKSPKQLTNKKIRKKRFSNRFYGVRAYTVTVSYRFLPSLKESGTKKTI